MTYTSLEKSYTKFGGETCPRPFFKKSKLSVSLDQQANVLYFVFIICPSHGLLKYIDTAVQSTCFFTSYKALSINKKVWN